MSMFFLTLLSLLTLNHVYADACVRQENSKLNIVYLHGMDTSSMSSQEKKHLELFKEFIKKKSYSLFAPWALEKCPDKKMNCWMWGNSNKKALKKKKEFLLKNARKCFRDSRPMVWIGFSNGGNLLNQFFRVCLRGSYITIGASGGVVLDEVKDMSACGQYLGIVGAKDKWNYTKALSLYHSFMKKNGNVKKMIHKKGHIISDEILTRDIEPFLQNYKEIPVLREKR